MRMRHLRFLCWGEPRCVRWDLMRTRHLLGRDPCCETHASRSSASTFACTENLTTTFACSTKNLNNCLDKNLKSPLQKKTRWGWWLLLNLRIFCCFLRDVDHHCWHIDQHLGDVELELQWRWTQENSTDIALPRLGTWVRSCATCCEIVAVWSKNLKMWPLPTAGSVVASHSFKSSCRIY